MRFFSEAVTDENGTFAFCQPIVSDDLESITLAPAESRYGLCIEPPHVLNLRQLGWPIPISVKPGSRSIYTLTPMSAAVAFHTFAFKYRDHEATSASELSEITLVFLRDGRQWLRLTYADFKEGFSLPSGTLRADINRGPLPINGPEVEITADSPLQLVFQMPSPATYRGRVIDGITKRPMAGVYVVPGNYGRGDPCSWTPQQWQELRDRATRRPTAGVNGLSSGQVVITDTDGRFQLTLEVDPSALFRALSP